MNTRGMQIYDDRRCSAEKLRGILERLPLQIKGRPISTSGKSKKQKREPVRLEAKMGAGRIIRINPIEGSIGDVALLIDNIDHIQAGQNYLSFNYQGQRYGIKYN